MTKEQLTEIIDRASMDGSYDVKTMGAAVTDFLNEHVQTIRLLQTDDGFRLVLHLKGATIGEAFQGPSRSDVFVQALAHVGQHVFGDSSA